HLGDAPRRADERGDHRDAEGGATSALLGEREPVETGHRMRLVAGLIEQDRDGRERTHSRQHTDHIADQHTDETPHQVVWFEGDAEAVPEISERSGNHECPHRNMGNGSCSTYENSSTPNNVTPAASTSELFSVAVRSPSAETNTHANVPATIPKNSPKIMNRIGPARIQPHPRHSLFFGRMASSSL